MCNDPVRSPSGFEQSDFSHERLSEWPYVNLHGMVGFRFTVIRPGRSACRAMYFSLHEHDTVLMVYPVHSPWLTHYLNPRLRLTKPASDDVNGRPHTLGR